MAFAVGGQFGMEFAIDAPWRIEPVENDQGQMDYGPIPVTITFHDVNFTLTGDKQVGRFLKVRVTERAQLANNQTSDFVTTILPDGLREIQRKVGISRTSGEPRREVCVPQQADCTALLKVAGSNEWHAMFWYRPKGPIAAGTNIHLEISVFSTTSNQTREWRNYVVVHLGEKPLPRFSRNWLYGDLHYHSEMTDNEGESGYSYRNVVRTMGAMGMDFAFATDHASGGVQQDSLGVQLGFGGEARDLNPLRFAVAKDILYRSDGANAAFGPDIVAGGFPRFRQLSLLPQLFMGEELDVVPEISGAEQSSGKLLFGDGQVNLWSNVSGCAGELCKAIFSEPADEANTIRFRRCFSENQSLLPPIERIIPAITNRIRAKCIDEYKQRVPEESRRFTILDRQGAITISVVPARQHLVYFPFDSTTSGAGFVADDTSAFGGATRHLSDIASDVSKNGVAFLAHPADGKSPGGENGPDIVAYSKGQLDEAWKSPGVLGLQLWNEDFTYVEDIESPKGNFVFQKLEFMSEFIDLRENKIKKYIFHLPWNTYRSVFDITPQSEKSELQDLYRSTPPIPWVWHNKLVDARAFDDRALVEANGGPAKRDLALVGTNADIYHGTVTLDAYLRKGLDPIATVELSWLPSGQPRRWFLAGGSDAHGDFNYRRRGRPATVTGTGGIPRPIPWSERPVSDGGIGKPRNLVLTDAPNGNPIADVPNLRLTTNKQVIGALRSGRFSVTDGPALRIVIDRNRNEIAEDSDFQMGSVVNRYPGEHIPVIVEWKSTPEFGRVKEIQLYVGNKDETFSDANEGPDRIIDYDLSGNTPSIYGRYSKLSDFKFIIPIAKKDAVMAGRVIYYLSAKHFLRSGNTASSLYIRAFAKTVNRQESDPSLQDCKTEFLHDSCGGRQAYSNPIWVLARPDCAGSQSDPLSIDSNGNAKADTCEGVRVEDPCAARGSTLVRGSFLITVFRNTPPVLDSGRPFGLLPTDVSTFNSKLDRSCRVFPLGGGVLVPTGGLPPPITQ